MLNNHSIKLVKHMKHVRHCTGINPDGTLIKFQSPKPNSPLAIAATSGDITALTLAASTDPTSLFTSDEYGNQPLIWAASQDQPEALKFILQYATEHAKNDGVNAQGYLGNTAIGRAARGGHLQCVKILLERKDINPNIPNEKKQFPLHFAAFKKHPEVVKAMLESGKCDTFVEDRKGRTPAEDTSVEEIRDMIIKYRETLKK